jgi:hypothetical protein
MRTRSQRARSLWLRFNAVPNSAATSAKRAFFIVAFAVRNFHRLCIRA